MGEIAVEAAAANFINGELVHVTAAGAGSVDDGVVALRSGACPPR